MDEPWIFTNEASHSPTSRIDTITNNFGFNHAKSIPKLIGISQARLRFFFLRFGLSNVMGVNDGLRTIMLPNKERGTLAIIEVSKATS